jgi:hypothetical protein
MVQGSRGGYSVKPGVSIEKMPSGIAHFDGKHDQNGKFQGKLVLGSAFIFDFQRTLS